MLGLTVEFVYSKEWEDELLHLYSTNGDSEESFIEIDRITRLLEMSEGSSDRRVVSALIKCLQISIPGQDETVYGTLGTIEVPIYYEVVFGSICDLIELDKENRYTDKYLPISLLDWYGYSLSNEELEKVVFPIAKKYLSVQCMQKILSLMAQYNFPDNSDKSYDPFYFYFESQVEFPSDETR